MFIIPISPLPALTGLSQAPSADGSKAASSSVPFADVFKNAVQNVRETQAQSEQDAYDLALGKTDDLHTVMIHSEKAATAIELTVQITSKAISAYNEIMRMQV